MIKATLTDELEAAAVALRDAEHSGVAIPPLSETFPSISVDEAYLVQRANLAQRCSAGERLVGRKIGLTSVAIQQQLGVDQPDYGAITDAMEIPDGGTCDPKRFIAPRLEAEFAFEIGQDLSLEPSEAELAQSIRGVAVAMELIDSRIVDWRISLADTVADNASMARVVWGSFVPATPELLRQLPGITLTLSRDGEAVTSGPGSAVLGHPLTSLHWLAKALGRQGDALRAGDRILAGAVSAAVPFSAGAIWNVSAAGLPGVTLYSAPNFIPQEAAQ